MNVHINGTFPTPLFRAFTRKEEAYDFVKRGKFRLKPLEHYRTIEDNSRKDKDEGEGKLNIWGNRPTLTKDLNSGKIIEQKMEPGLIHYGVSSITPVYILCFSGPQVNIKYLKRNFGPHIVRIYNPALFVNKIASYLEQQPIASTIWIECVQIIYDKGTLRLEKPTIDERLSLEYSQKYPKDADDYEYRIVVRLPVTLDPQPAEIAINLGRQLNFAEVYKQKNNS